LDFRSWSHPVAIIGAVSNLLAAARKKYVLPCLALPCRVVCVIIHLRGLVVDRGNIKGRDWERRTTELLN
jgi:hypothetical protein